MLAALFLGASLVSCDGESPPDVVVIPPTPTSLPTIVPSAVPTLAEVETQEESLAQQTENIPLQDGNLQDSPGESTVEPSQGLETRPHREEPAPPNLFVADSSEYFGGTGQPQLIEIFTYW